MRSVFRVVAFIALLAMPAPGQSSPQIELPKIEEPAIIATTYNRRGQGKISAADREGHVHQYMEVWEDKSKVPSVVTYVLVGEDAQRYYSVTWGRGPVNRDAFTCKAADIPEFGEKSLWVASTKEGFITFKEIEDKDVKDLFSNLARARRDWDAEVGSANPKRNANTTQSNILNFLKKKNREKWLQLGWLQVATTCMRHF